MNWIPFEKDGDLPPERRYVLVQCAEQPEIGMPPCVAVGYLRYAAGDIESPYFVMPGVGGIGHRKTVTHWCDCLGDDFTAPLWPGTHPGALTRRFQKAPSPPPALNSGV